jgi:hypothetical protein
MQKKIGEIEISGSNYYNNSNKINKPLWISFYSYRNDIYSTFYFTMIDNPENETWYKYLQTIFNIRIIPKGNIRYGYYYKVLCSYPIDKMKTLIDNLNSFKDNRVSFNITKKFDDIYSEMIIKLI